MLPVNRINDDSGIFSDIFSRYVTCIEEVNNDSIWQGLSKDNAVSKAETFISEFQEPLSSQFNNLSLAVTTLNSYKSAKKYYDAYVYNYNVAVQYNDTNNINSYKHLRDYYSGLVTTYKSQIISYLNQVTAVKLAASRREFINFYQTDYSDSYGYGTTIATSGCGPTSMAMVATYLLGEVHDPVEMANWSLSHGHRIKDQGTTWAYFGEISSVYGINCVQSSTTAQRIYDSLSADKPVILIMHAGHFTSGGHFIVLTGIDDDGRIIVADPNSRERSNVTWDINLLVNESNQMWSFDI